MKNWRVLIFGVLIGIACLSLHRALLPGAENALNVRFNLSGRLADIQNKELIAVFSEDMIPLGTNPAGGGFLSIAPDCPGDYLWRGTRILAFRPKDRFRYSTHYRATVPAGLKALNGRTLKEAAVSEFTTPLPEAIAIRNGNQDFIPVPYENWRRLDNVWVKDPLSIKFNQPMAAEDVKRGLSVVGKKSRRPAVFKIKSIKDTVIAIRWISPLEREAEYELGLKRGLCGKEGNIGRDKDFSINFTTTPAFRLKTAKTIDLPCDEKEIELDFSNPLAEANLQAWSSKVKLEKTNRDRSLPIHFSVKLYEENLSLELADSPRPGDKLKLRLPPNIANIHGERLGQVPAIDIRVCSAAYPILDAELGGDSPRLEIKSIREADVAIFRLSDDLLFKLPEQLNEDSVFWKQRQDFGFFKKILIPKKFLQREARMKVRGMDDDETRTLPLNLEKDLGAQFGFFGIMTRRALPFNSCSQLELFHFPAMSPFLLRLVHRRSIDFILYNGQGQSLVWAFDNRTGAPVGNHAVRLRRGRADLALGKTGPDGLFRSASGLNRGDIVIVSGNRDSDLAFIRIPKEPEVLPPDYRAEIFTERDFYRPGDKVYIGGVIKERRAGRLMTSKLKSVTMKILDPDDKTIFTEDLNLDTRGGFSASYRPPKDLIKGTYQVEIHKDSLLCSRQIEINYYEPNVFEVILGRIEPRYLRAGTFSTTIFGVYYSGNPMAGDKAEFRLAVAPDTDLKDWASKANISGYCFNLDKHFRKTDSDYKKEAVFDREGRLSVLIPLTHFRQLNHAAKLNFSVTGKSDEGKEFTTSASALFFPGRRLCGLKVPSFNNINSEIKSKLLLLDEKGAPVSGSVAISVFKIDWRGSQFTRVASKIWVKVEAGNAEYGLRVPEPGYYLLKADARDERGHITSSSCEFFAWDSNRTYEDQHLELHSESSSCHIGDTVTCYLLSPRAGQALLAVETDRICDIRVLEIQKTTPIEIRVKKEYFPRFSINVLAPFLTNALEEAFPFSGLMGASQEFKVEDAAHRLEVRIEAPQSVKPAANLPLKLRVFDAQKKGIKAKVFVSVVDEGALSLSGYETPDLYDALYIRSGLRYPKMFSSRETSRWIFRRPLMDITPGDRGIFGCVMQPDGTPVPGAAVFLQKQGSKRALRKKTSAAGYYVFRDLAFHNYTVWAETGDTSSVKFITPYQKGLYPLDLVMIPKSAKLDSKISYTVNEIYGGGLGGAWERGHDLMTCYCMACKREVDISGIRVRSDMREVLLFTLIETNDQGEAKVNLQTSDQLSTYRIMAAAYAEHSFGKDEKRLLVSKDVLLTEAMPEFARSGDSFNAGVQVSNRTQNPVGVTVVAEPKGISIGGDERKKIVLSPNANRLVPFAFRADAPAEARLTFYAMSASDKDGLLKELTVTDNLIPESHLDFDSGRSIQKRVHPPENAERSKLVLTLTPTIIKPAAKIAVKLALYPYDCLEQRTSKLLLSLALTDDLLAKMGLRPDRDRERQALGDYLRALPEFMTGDGGLSYFRGSPWSSDYLTVYVLWALQLARKAGHTVNPQIVSRIENHLRSSKLSPCGQAFFQFLLSLDGKADLKKLRELYENRERLQLPSRVFLFRALGFQMNDRAKQSVMAAEFRKGLQVESDFAYFDAREFAYDHDLPFYSSRYATSLILQALLEWEKSVELAPLLINWLLEAQPHEWQTTQTNFWVLYAAAEYIKKLEQSATGRAKVVLLGQVKEKQFAGPQDTWTVEKDLANQRADFDVKVSADQMVYLSTELNSKLRLPGAAGRGISVTRNVYGQGGKIAAGFKKGDIYQVELLLSLDKEVPYAVVDEPLAAGFDLMRQDTASRRTLKEFNSDLAKSYQSPWMRQERAADRLVWYSYRLEGRVRLIYFIKAMYSGSFTWLPTRAQGMYHPQFFGRCATRRIEIKDN